METKPKRRWYQFSLRATFVVLTLGISLLAAVGSMFDGSVAHFEVIATKVERPPLESIIIGSGILVAIATGGVIALVAWWRRQYKR